MKNQDTRPRKKAPRQAENYIKIYLKDSEYEAIRDAAEKVGLSMSAWLRVTALKEAQKTMR